MDGQISEPVILLGYVFAFAIFGNLIFTKINPKPKDYVRRGLPLVAFWNMFSREKWTPEGVRYHKRQFILAIPTLIAFLLGYLVLDWIW